jgi:hypothetical protein
MVELQVDEMQDNKSSLTDSPCSDDDWNAFKAKLEYYKLLFERVKLQEEVRDRWYRNYLLIMASTVTVLGLAFEFAARADRVAQIFFSSLGFFLGIVGILSFQIHLSQRYNYTVYLRRMQLLDDIFFYPKLVDEKLISRMRKPLPPNPTPGADRSAQLFYLFTNSLVLGTSGLAVGQTIKLPPKVMAFLVPAIFVASISFHFWRMLSLDRALTQLRELPSE